MSSITGVRPILDPVGDVRGWYRCLVAVRTDRSFGQCDPLQTGLTEMIMTEVLLGNVQDFVEASHHRGDRKGVGISAADCCDRGPASDTEPWGCRRTTFMAGAERLRCRSCVLFCAREMNGGSIFADSLQNTHLKEHAGHEPVAPRYEIRPYASQVGV